MIFVRSRRVISEPKSCKTAAAAAAAAAAGFDDLVSSSLIIGEQGTGKKDVNPPANY
jgi:hypothetical protein